MSAVSNIDLEFEDDEVLPGGTPSSQVQIKEIVVRVNTGRPTLPEPHGTPEGGHAARPQVGVSGGRTTE